MNAPEKEVPPSSTNSQSSKVSLIWASEITFTYAVDVKDMLFYCYLARDFWDIYIPRIDV